MGPARQAGVFGCKMEGGPLSSKALGGMLPPKLEPMQSEELNKREFLYLLLSIVGLLAACAAAAASIWFFLPRSPDLVVVSVDELTSSAPVYVSIQPGLSVYAVKVDGGVAIWDAASPVSGCRVHWVKLEGRFEDPCSGAKWCLDGSIADHRFREATTLTYYPAELSRDGDVLINPLELRHGSPLPQSQWISDAMALEDAIVECTIP